MKRVQLLVLLVLLLSALVVRAQDDEVVFTLERSACFGTCPVYKISILASGLIRYEGESSVEVTGEQSASLDGFDVEKMVAEFEEAGYFEWDEAYDTQTVSDLPTVTTSVTRDGETHQIVRYTGDDSAPLLLPYLELYLDMATRSERWTGVVQEIAYVPVGDVLPMATIQRTRCFGSCPVYAAAVYEDGMVVYIGVKFVREIGLRVIRDDFVSLDQMASYAEGFNYFNLNDEYTAPGSDEKATVYSSVRIGDEFKHIERFTGDGSAVLSLVWMEDYISNRVTTLILQ